MRKILLLILVLCFCTVTVFAATSQSEEGLTYVQACLIGSLAFGFVVALIITLVMKSKLKSVRSQRAAANYERPGSMHLTQSRDLYLYSTVTRIKKPEPSRK